MFESQKIQRPHGLRKIQNGRNGHSSRTGAPRGLGRQGGHEESLPAHTSPRRIPKIPPVPLEGKKVEVSLCPVRTTRSATSFHKNHEASTGVAEGAGHKTSMLFRRHISPVPFKRKLSKRLGDSTKSPHQSRLLNKFQKIGSDPHPKNPVFGDHDRHQKDGVQCPKAEVEEILARGKEVQQQIIKTSFHHAPPVSWLGRETKFNFPGHGRHGASHKGLAVGPCKGLEASSSKSFHVEPKSIFTSSSSSSFGPTVVGNGSPTVERKVCVAKGQPRPHNFDRRLRHRVCRGITDTTQTSDSDTGQLVSQRGGVPVYKLKGIGSNLPDSFRLSKTQEMVQEKVTSIHRQYGMQVGSKQMYSKNTRHVSHFKQDAFMPESTQDSLGGQSYSGSGKCNGRHRKSPEVRDGRLEIARRPIRHVGPGMGSTHNGLDCVQVEHTTAPFLQLDVRSGGDLYRCPQVPPSKGKWVLKSPLFPNRQDPTASTDQKSHHDDRGSSLEVTAMVASTDKYVRGRSDNVVRHNNITTRFSSSSSSTTHLHPSRLPGGYDHLPTGVGGSRLSHIRESLAKQGLPAKVIDRLGSAWKASTIASYESPWSAWQNHCRKEGVSVNDPSVSNFLSFLENTFEKGVAHSTYNTAASSVATAIHLSSGVNLSTNPVVMLFRKALRNEKPPVPKYEDTWDIGILFKYLSSLGINSKLSLSVLTLKVIILLKIDLMGRGSDLSKAFRSQVVFSGAKSFRIRMYSTKEQGKSSKFSHGKWTKWVEVGDYPKDRKICSVSTLKAYIKRTTSSEYANDICVEGKQTRGLFASIVVAKSGQSKGKFWSLSSQRISKYVLEGMSKAGIDVSKYGAHSTRHASVSMARDAGANLEKVLCQARMSSKRNFEKFYYRSVERFRKKKVSASSSLALFVRASV
jgi:hypothetical protein